MNNSNDHVRVWGIVPAAGLSRRMGRPKQTLDFDGSTITGSTVEALLAAGLSGVVVVTRSELVDRLKLPADPRVQVEFNDAPHSEMIDSVRVGLSALKRRHTGERDGVTVLPGDMPTIHAETCRKCAAAYAADPRRIVIATSGGKRGHPLVFPLAMRPVVGGLAGGLNLLPRGFPERVYLVPVDDLGTRTDVDSLHDYSRLLDRSWRGGRPA